MASKNIENIVSKISLPILMDLGFELVDVEFKKEGVNYYLRVYIDKQDGITLDDCQKASQRISDELDKLDPIPYSYFFEVSSPGLDRPLKRDIDFVRYSGSKVELKLYKQIGGKKVFSGELIGLKGDLIAIKSDNKIMEFLRKDVAIIRLAVEF